MVDDILKENINAQKCINHAYIMPYYACNSHYLKQIVADYLATASCEISAWSLNDFYAKVKKVQKMPDALLC